MDLVLKMVIVIKIVNKRVTVHLEKKNPHQAKTQRTALIFKRMRRRQGRAASANAGQIREVNLADKHTQEPCWRT